MNADKVLSLLEMANGSDSESNITYDETMEAELFPELEMVNVSSDSELQSIVKSASPSNTIITVHDDIESQPA
jgi:hypothetical protein